MKNNLSVVVLGNKKDLSSRREGSTEEARSFSEDNAWAYFEVSAAEWQDSEDDDESLQDHDKVVNLYYLISYLNRDSYFWLTLFCLNN